MLQDLPENVCVRCGKECKDIRGKKIHEARCTGVTEMRCEGCNQEFSNSYGLQRHRSICSTLIKHKEEQLYEEKIKKITNDYEEKIKKITNDYEEKIKKTTSDYEIHIKLLHYNNEETIKKMTYDHDTKVKDLTKEIQSENRRYDTLLNESSSNADRLYTEVQSLKQALKNQIEQTEAIKEEKKRLENECKSITQDLLQYYKKAYNHSSATHNSNSNNNNSQTYNINSQNQNNFFIQAFDYAQCIDKIKPPNTTVFSIPDMVNLLFDSGFGNHVRTTDRSRNAMIWNKPEIGQIRDSNGNDLSNFLFDQFQDKIESQQEYVESELNKLIAADYPYDSLLNAKRKHIEFCRQFKNKDQTLIDKLRKEIGKRAKDVKDESIDEIKRSKFSNILFSLEKELFPRIDEWIILSPKEFGSYLGRLLSDLYWTEGASSGSEEILPYIISRDDNKKTCRVTYQELGEVLFLSISDKFSSKDIRDIIFRMIEVWLREKTIDTYEDAYNRSLVLLQGIEDKQQTTLDLIIKGMVSFKQH
jgi:DNA repair exonuclease SbcCD ATPase subunit